MSTKTKKQFLKHFGVLVKQERMRLGFTQKELAQRFDISHEWLCKIEKGKAFSLSLELMHEICLFMGVELSVHPIGKEEASMGVEASI